MGVFGKNYKIIKGSTCSWSEVAITVTAKAGGTLVIATTGSPTWTFVSAPNFTDATWLAGARSGTTDRLDVYGSCAVVGANDRFKYIIGIRRPANGSPDDQVVEWVAEDQG